MRSASAAPSNPFLSFSNLDPKSRTGFFKKTNAGTWSRHGLETNLKVLGGFLGLNRHQLGQKPLRQTKPPLSPNNRPTQNNQYTNINSTDAESTNTNSLESDTVYEDRAKLLIAHAHSTTLKTITSKNPLEKQQSADSDISDAIGIDILSEGSNSQSSTASSSTQASQESSEEPSGLDAQAIKVAQENDLIEQLKEFDPALSLKELNQNKKFPIKNEAILNQKWKEDFIKAHEKEKVLFFTTLRLLSTRGGLDALAHIGNETAKTIIDNYNKKEYGFGNEISPENKKLDWLQRLALAVETRPDDWHEYLNFSSQTSTIGSHLQAFNNQLKVFQETGNDYAYNTLKKITVEHPDIVLYKAAEQVLINNNSETTIDPFEPTIEPNDEEASKKNKLLSEIYRNAYVRVANGIHGLSDTAEARQASAVQMVERIKKSKRHYIEHHNEHHNKGWLARLLTNITKLFGSKSANFALNQSVAENAIITKGFNPINHKLHNPKEAYASIDKSTARDELDSIADHLLNHRFDTKGRLQRSAEDLEHAAILSMAGAYKLRMRHGKEWGFSVKGVSTILTGFLLFKLARVKAGLAYFRGNHLETEISMPSHAAELYYHHYSSEHWDISAGGGVGKKYALPFLAKGLGIEATAGVTGILHKYDKLKIKKSIGIKLPRIRGKNEEKIKSDLIKIKRAIDNPLLSPEESLWAAFSQNPELAFSSALDGQEKSIERGIGLDLNLNTNAKGALRVGAEGGVNYINRKQTRHISDEGQMPTLRVNQRIKNMVTIFGRLWARVSFYINDNTRLSPNNAIELEYKRGIVGAEGAKTIMLATTPLGGISQHSYQEIVFQNPSDYIRHCLKTQEAFINTRIERSVWVEKNIKQSGTTLSEQHLENVEQRAEDKANQDMNEHLEDLGFDFGFDTQNRNENNKTLVLKAIGLLLLHFIRIPKYIVQLPKQIASYFKQRTIKKKNITNKTLAMKDAEIAFLHERNKLAGKFAGAIEQLLKKTNNKINTQDPKFIELHDAYRQELLTEHKKTVQLAIDNLAKAKNPHYAHANQLNYSLRSEIDMALKKRIIDQLQDLIQKFPNEESYKNQLQQLLFDESSYEPISNRVYSLNTGKEISSLLFFRSVKARYIRHTQSSIR